MSRFTYIAILESGKKVAGQIRSADRRQAVRQLIGRGYHPVQVRPDREQAGVWRRWAQAMRNHVSSAKLSVFTRQLASLLKAGLPMLQALMVLRRQSESRRLVYIIEDIQEHLSAEGGTLAEALDEHPQVFDSVYRSLVRAGEEGGNLPEVLLRLADHLGSAARLRGQVLGAFIYPVFLLLMGAAAVFVLMTFVIPRFRELFDSFGQALPRPTQLLIAVSGFLAAWWWAVGAGLLAGMVFLGLVLRRPQVRTKVDRGLLRLPVFGSMVLKLEIARISRTLGALLTGGVGVLGALRITAGTARNRAVQAALGPVADGVASGESVAEVADKAGIFPPLMINLIRTGEETGQLPSMLDELSAIYEDQAQRAVTGAVKLLEPMLIIVIGAVVAGIVAAIMLPVFQANTMVS